MKGDDMEARQAEPVIETDEEYRTIERTLLETARGRWFLAEHSRRSRRLETSQLEGAIEQLKSSLRAPPALVGRLESEIELLGNQIRQVRADLVARQRGETAPVASTGAAASATPTSTPSGLLRAAEDLHELVWSLQSSEVDADLCNRIGRQAAQIFALSAGQAAESARAQRLAASLDTLLERVGATLETIRHEATPDEERKASVKGG
jgi:uncharacterized coiled-coil protein SlyX